MSVFPLNIWHHPKQKGFLGAVPELMGNRKAGWVVETSDRETVPDWSTY